MTEQEAKTKWCPAVRFDGQGPNRVIEGGGNTTLCIGSACMAWRWAERMVEMAVEPPLPRDGYCGLAGNP